MTNRIDKLDALVAQLEPALQPERDLWPQIDKAIAAGSGGFWQWRVAASAVAATLLIGLLKLNTLATW